MSFDALADARDILVDSLYATMRSSASTAVFAVGLHAEGSSGGGAPRVLGAEIASSEVAWAEVLSSADLSLSTLLRQEATWRPLARAGLPQEWTSALRSRGILSVALLSVSDSEGLSGLVLYATRQDRQRTPIDITGGLVAAALNSLRQVLAEHLTPPCMIVWGEGSILGASKSARRWVEVFGYDVEAAYDGSSPHGEKFSALSGVVVLESVALVGSAHFVTNLDVATPVPPIASARLAKRLREAAALAATGASVPEIATEMGISPETVRGYLKEVYRELGVANRLELARCLGTLQ